MIQIFVLTARGNASALDKAFSPASLYLDSIETAVPVALLPHSIRPLCRTLEGEKKLTTVKMGEGSKKERGSERKFQ